MEGNRSRIFKVLLQNCLEDVWRTINSLLRTAVLQTIYVFVCSVLNDLLRTSDYTARVRFRFSRLWL
jgi:hypothetical protein